MRVCLCVKTSACITSSHFTSSPLCSFIPPLSSYHPVSFIQPRPCICLILAVALYQYNFPMPLFIFTLGISHLALFFIFLKISCCIAHRSISSALPLLLLTPHTSYILIALCFYFHLSNFLLYALQPSVI